MTSEREYISSVQDYDVAGNAIRAFFAPDNRLICVLDLLITEIKPNVLLVINPDENRKWDDILENDFGVDLETVRPKKDNKYQKLDIEYSGLDLYERLIQDSKNNNDLTDVLNDLNLFRKNVAKRVASERLKNAEVVVENARETVDKADEKIKNLQDKSRKIQINLVEARKNIGKEPTKQSAAKILRLESQVEAVGEQIRRAKKRMQNAQKRELTAQDEIDGAKKILNMLADENLPATPVMTDLVAQTVPSVPANVKENNEIYETKATEMDDEVKPLFDKNPENLDEELAFKPIEFQVPAGYVQKQPETDSLEQHFESDAENQGADSLPYAQINDDAQQNQVAAQEKTALDVFVPVDTESDSETVKYWDNVTTPEPQNNAEEYAKDNATAPVQPQIESDEYPIVPETSVAPAVDAPRPVAVEPVVDAPSPVAAEPVVAPIVSELRPVPPVGSGFDTVKSNNGEPNKVLYYVMLIGLIVLSVFTLWLYQNSSNKALPELGATTQAPVIEETVTEPELAESDDLLPFIEEPVVETTPQEPVVEQVEEPVVEEVEEVIEAPVVEEPVVEEPVVEEVIERVVAPAPVVEEAPVVSEPVVNKPAYNVSQNEKMFVAAPEYEADEYVETEIETCADGNAPDMDGCCTGETLTEMQDGELMCCPDGSDDGECFPPLK